ncbi:hypothetical protein [Planococcus ruber]|uniref:hypothetical protein n=1 Tax=Planococcus ruber TaxID=2027871 RepID=UPI001FEDF9E1|nr:hypothetical protein [Planococcus ruber]MCJ1907727.1 hypothetical protein [Planococcus ruber]
MNPSETWQYILTKANSRSFEIPTTPQNKRIPKWFSVSRNDEYIVVANAKTNSPSVSLKNERRITFSDFESIFDYYEIRKNGAKGISKEVAAKSMNSAYIFALIDDAYKTAAISV